MQTAEAYLGRSQEYWKQAKQFLKERHFLKVSELGWGSVVQITNGLAVKKGIKLTSHRQTIDFIRNTANRLDDKDMYRFLQEAEKLHANFYHEFLDEVDVRESFSAVERLLEKIGYLLAQEAK